MLKAGIKRSTLEAGFDKLDPAAITTDDFTRIRKWIEKFYLDFYLPLMKVRNLLSDEIWNRYEKLIGEASSEMREVILLREAQAKLRLAWNSRPEQLRRVWLRKYRIKREVTAG